jgi:hypothetical protein
MNEHRWPDAWRPGERLDEYERIVVPVEPRAYARAQSAQTYALNLRYHRDWRTGMWHHADEPHAWFTLGVIVAMNPIPAPTPCFLCRYTPAFYGAACACD